MIDLDHLPTEIRQGSRCVLWNYEERDGERTKVPYIPTKPNKKASSTNPTTWGTFDEAYSVHMEGKSDGVGWVPIAGVIGVDLDHCRDPKTGTIAPHAHAIVQALGSYTEITPSETGLRVYVRGTLPPQGRVKSKGAIKIEMYDGGGGRYFTVTGRHLDGTPATIEERTAQLQVVHAQIFGVNGNGQRPRPAPAAPVTEDDATLIDRARRAKNGDRFAALWAGDTSGHPSPSEADLALCDHLAFWTVRDATRMDRLFRQSGLMRPKWDKRHGDQTYGEKTIEKAIADCAETYTPAASRATGTKQAPTTDESAQGGEPLGEAPPEPLILDPADPLPSARAFVAQAHTRAKLATLQHHGGVFYVYGEGNAYADRDEAAVRADLYAFLEPAQRWVAKGPLGALELAPFKPTKSRMENVLDALRAVTNLPSAYTPPCWLRHAPPLDPFDIVACRNGLLHIPTRRLLPGTPDFFTLTALPFAFDPTAPEPIRWIQFLTELWPEDPECRDTLQEMFGYALTPRTHYQKVFMMVGPKRSGKGTIGRVARCLLGDRNVCGPTLGNLGEQFGLATLIGKSLAIIADARISGRTDTATLTERLLSISGEDTLSIPRKYLPDWTGKLPTRFFLLTNELPRIEDASGALASRFIVLTLSKSFYGMEDHGLFERFLPELPGILNWALAGWDRLYARGRFVQPRSSTELLQQFEDLGSPVAAFIREMFEIGPGYEVAQASLFSTWKNWCEANGRERPGTTQRLGRDLRSAFPWLRSSQPSVDGERVRCWIGLRLKT